MARQLTQDLSNEYQSLFSSMQIRPERQSQAKKIGDKIAAARGRYANVSATTSVPWFVIGLIHSLEASLRFDRHLHNGDPLTARTTHVPAGRPAGDPPFIWEKSAADALGFRRVNTLADWSLPGIAFVLERYNGWGYRDHHPEMKSPYLWSFSNVYRRGKYVADGNFSPEAVSQQCGGMTLLRYLMDSDPTVAAAVGFNPTPPTEEEETTRSFPVIDGPEGSEPPAVGPEAAPPAFPGRYILNGAKGEIVAKIQQQLLSFGIAPGPIDGEFGELTEGAVRVFQSRSADLSGRPLEIDGIVGPNTWASLFGMGATIETPPAPQVSQPAAPQLAQLVVETADAEVGVREVPLGSNRGPRVNQYIRAVGLDPDRDHYPWCMCFVFWCFDQAARQLRLANPVPQTGSVQTAWRALKASPGRSQVILAETAQRDPSLVAPGSVFFLKTGSATGHTGIISGNFNGQLETIEGNTNDAGGREGIGVFRRTRRKVTDVNLGFVSFA